MITVNSNSNLKNESIDTNANVNKDKKTKNDPPPTDISFVFLRDHLQVCIHTILFQRMTNQCFQPIDCRLFPYDVDYCMLSQEVLLNVETKCKYAFESWEKKNPESLNPKATIAFYTRGILTESLGSFLFSSQGSKEIVENWNLEYSLTKKNNANQNQLDSVVLKEAMSLIVEKSKKLNFLEIVKDNILDWSLNIENAKKDGENSMTNSFYFSSFYKLFNK